MAGVPGFEPGNDGIKTRCLTAWRYPNGEYFRAAYTSIKRKMAGVPGFEPGDDGIKTRCLTAWRYPTRALLLKENGAGGET